MLTDRDIVVEVVGRGLDPAVTEIGSLGGSGMMVVVPIDADLDQVVELMATRKVRRLPVIDENRRVVGMVSQADVATHADRCSSGKMLAGISAT
jgi:CBS domain-containing protein